MFCCASVLKFVPFCAPVLNSVVFFVFFLCCGFEACAFFCAPVLNSVVLFLDASESSSGSQSEKPSFSCAFLVLVPVSSCAFLVLPAAGPSFQ